MQWIRTSRSDDRFTDHVISGAYEVLVEYRSDWDFGEVRVKPFHDGYIYLGKAYGNDNAIRAQAVELAKAYIQGRGS